MKLFSMLLICTSMLIGVIIGNKYYYLLPLHEAYQSASAVIYPTKDQTVHGIVTFKKEKNGIRVQATIHNLTPGDHGFHVHQYGECSSPDGMCTGDHFNPTHAPHGRPEDDHVHVGDFGNITADESGVGKYDKLNKHIKLFGPHSIIGRSIIIHKDPDDLTTQPTGNSGARIGCGVIGIANNH